MFKKPFQRIAQKLVSSPQDDFTAVRKAARATIFWAKVRPDFLKNESDAAHFAQAEKLLRDGAFGADHNGETPESEAALLELSGALRDAYAAPRVLAREADEALHAFAPLHDALMENIEADDSYRASSRARVLAAARKASGARPRFSWKITPAKFALASTLFCAAAFGGHFIGSKNASRELPVQSLVDDFDNNLQSAAPLEFVSDDSRTPVQSAQLISDNIGLKVDAPPRHAGVKLIGARRHPLWNRLGVQARYMKNGVPFTLYKIREPRCALDGLGEVQVNGRTYLHGQRGQYHVVVWRSGEEVMTMVSPLASQPSLDLARSMREGIAPM